METINQEELKDFLFKLDERSKEELAKIMEEHNLDKTKATRHALVWYRDTKNRLVKMEERALKAEQGFYELRQKLKNFLKAKEELEKSI